MDVHITFLIHIVSFCLVVYAVDYSSLQSLDVACEDRRDSCAVTRHRNFTSRNCECDRHCGFFRDCCVDSRHRQVGVTRQKLSCVAHSTGDAAYMVDRCPLAYPTNEMRRRCQNSTDLKDPVMSAPTTDVVNKITFKNRYCAECNGANIANLKTWLIINDCQSLNDLNVNSSYVWQNIRYDNTRKKWGVSMGGEFHRCDLLFGVPEYVRISVRPCRAHLVATCAANWMRQAVRMDCESYEAAVYHEGRGFKNAHCAICNHVPTDRVTCTAGGFLISRGRKPFSFAMLLDVNQSGGEEVGVSNRCPSQQKYDPYFKKCRPLVCALPGYSRVNGQCVRL